MIETPAHRREAAARVARTLEDADTIAVSTHINGDGDGWGSACALAHHFRPLGTRVHLLAATPMPERFDFLLPEGEAPLEPGERAGRALAAADVQIVVDVSESDRLGDFAADYDPARTLIIDHHAVASSRIAAADALIDPDASATAELIYDVLIATGEPLSRGAARALYVGLVTDTGSFRYSNATPHAHRLAAALVEVGVEPEALYAPLYATLTPQDLKTLAVALNALERDEPAGITWTELGPEFVGLDDYDHIIEHVRNVRGTRIALLFRDLGDGTVKVSLRSGGPADVAEVASRFGGGGHRKAAGARLPGELEEVVDRVLSACREALASPT